MMQPIGKGTKKHYNQIQRSQQMNLVHFLDEMTYSWPWSSNTEMLELLRSHMTTDRSQLDE